jgi:hypothetical protein
MAVSRHERHQVAKKRNAINKLDGNGKGGAMRRRRLLFLRPLVAAAAVAGRWPRLIESAAATCATRPTCFSSAVRHRYWRPDNEPEPPQGHLHDMFFPVRNPPGPPPRLLPVVNNFHSFRRQAWSSHALTSHRRTVPNICIFLDFFFTP